MIIVHKADGAMWQQELRWTGTEIGFVVTGPPTLRAVAPKKPPGVGSIFRQFVKSKYDVQECAACRETAERMDALGPDGCEKEKAALLNEIWERRNELKGWRWLAAKFPGAKAPALAELGALFDQAVSEARTHSSS